MKVDIVSMNGDRSKSVDKLNAINENYRFIWAQDTNGTAYKIDKRTGEVFKSGKKVASTSKVYFG